MNSRAVIRVRMAPSPSGFFHIGSARTALYNWLFARHSGGEFILRVEDTDAKRSSEDMIGVILDGMKWLGLDWKEIHYQSRRTELYRQYLRQLLDRDLAYYCYCDPKELEKERIDAYQKKVNWQYDRRCLKLTAEERLTREKAQGRGAVRFLVPDRAVAYNDIVHGDIRREAKDIEDFVIFRPDQTPTYNFACVVDDHDMGITHVIRGHDHITNTPKQVLLCESFGWSPPQFAHLPLILGKDKSKLSKRHGAVSIMEYKEQGFLPEAVFNYIALLGWSPGDNREIMGREELVAAFTLERINSANAVFDVEKLEWMNQQYLLGYHAEPTRNDDRILKLYGPVIVQMGFATEAQIDQDRRRIIDICDLMAPRIKRLGEMQKAAYFFVDDFPCDDALVRKHRSERTLAILGAFMVVLRELPAEDFGDPAKGPALIEACLKDFAQNGNLKPKEIIHPLRVAISGTDAGPGLYEMMQLVGKDRVKRRIEKFLSQK